MKKFLSKKVIIGMLVLLVTCIGVLAFVIFNKGGTDPQTESLVKLAKVWGFVKYRHPSVTSGEIDWDEELLHVIPLVLDAKGSKSTNKVIYTWLESFPFEIQELDAELVPVKDEFDKGVVLKPNLVWIEDSTVFGEDLSGYLKRLSEVVVTDTSNGYASFPNGDIYVNMDKENAYPLMEYDDIGLRLLGLFRYWNVIEYFYPYKDIIGEDWNAVLMEMIPKFLSGEDEQSYVLSVAELSTRIHDSHVWVSDPEQIVRMHLGGKSPEVEFYNIDGKIVISAITDADKNDAAKLQLGDVVLSMDGIGIEERINNCKKYLSLSNDDRFAASFRYYLLGTDQDTAKIEVLRDQKKLMLDVKCEKSKQQLSGQQPSGLIEDGRIGYINPSMLAPGDIDKLMEEFQETQGLIVDLRYYPTDFIAYSLAEYLIPSPVPFVRFGFCNQFNPGEFTLAEANTSGRGTMGDPDATQLYTGKVVILMDETSQSQSELTVMSLRNAPDAVVLGSPSVGTDGDIVAFPLPGELMTFMTGLSVYHPDGTQTQRVGIEPDVYFVPTIEQIKSGTDALLDEAITLIN